MSDPNETFDDEDEPDEVFDDDDGEPVGSCEECGTNLYAEDDAKLCGQCLFAFLGTESR